MSAPDVYQSAPASFVEETEDTVHALRMKKEAMISEIENGSCTSLSRFETYRIMLDRIDTEIETLESRLYGITFDRIDAEIAKPSRQH